MIGPKDKNQKKKHNHQPLFPQDDVEPSETANAEFEEENSDSPSEILKPIRKRSVVAEPKNKNSNDGKKQKKNEPKEQNNSQKHQLLPFQPSEAAIDTLAADEEAADAKLSDVFSGDKVSEVKVLACEASSSILAFSSGTSVSIASDEEQPNYQMKTSDSLAVHSSKAIDTLVADEKAKIDEEASPAKTFTSETLSPEKIIIKM